MKFACERCGKRYASVDEPAAGRVYRIRCRCGHVIVVRGPAAAPRGPDVQSRRFEPSPLPPPLAAPDVEEPSRAEEPPRRARAPEEDAANVEALPHAAGEAPSPAPVTAPRTPVEEPDPAIEDDPFLGAVAGAKREARRPAEISDDEGWRADPSPERGDPLAAERGGAAALPVALPLGLEEDGASARRHVLLAAILALLAFAAALAVWSM